MLGVLNLVLVGEYDHSFVPHAKTDESIGHLALPEGVVVKAQWVSALDLVQDEASPLTVADAIWVAPGSPYRSIDGALRAIRYGRESGIPVLGTCGGCQHMVIEYARNVLGFLDAEHAEYDPYASNLFVTPLSCSLVGQTMAVCLTPNSLAARAYGETVVSEQYYCNFGINPAHEATLDAGGLRIIGRDEAGEARIFTLPDHPFYVATLFVPQLTSRPGRPHPLIQAFIDAALTLTLERSTPAD